MIKRGTSIDAYNKIKEEGLLSRRRWEAYDALTRNGPCTGMELNQFMGRKSSVDSQVRARLTELRELGVAEECGEVLCSVTGQRVILWDVTPGLPVKFDKPKRRKCKACNGHGYFEEAQARLL